MIANDFKVRIHINQHLGQKEEEKASVETELLNKLDWQELSCALKIGHSETLVCSSISKNNIKDHQVCTT